MHIEAPASESGAVLENDGPSRIEYGPGSHHAVMLADLRERRAKDEQVHCFQLGEFLVVSPVPTAEEQVQLQLAYEAAHEGLEAEEHRRARRIGGSGSSKLDMQSLLRNGRE